MIHNPNNKYAIEARQRADELEKRVEEETKRAEEEKKRAEEEKRRAEVAERSRQEEKIEMEHRIAELEAKLAQAKGTGHTYTQSNQLTFCYSILIFDQLIPLNRPIQSFIAQLAARGLPT